MDNAFEYAQVSALESSADYPYSGKDDTCDFQTEKGLVKLKGFVDVPEKDPEALKVAVAVGPVSVAVQASGII